MNHISSDVGSGKCDGAEGFWLASCTVFDYVHTGRSCLDYTNPDIAGVGVVLSAVVAAGLVTTSLICLKFLERRRRAELWQKVFRCFIRASADSQGIVGVALLVSAHVTLRNSKGQDTSAVNYQNSGYFTLVGKRRALLFVYFVFLPLLFWLHTPWPGAYLVAAAFTVYICSIASSTHLASILSMRPNEPVEFTLEDCEARSNGCPESNAVTKSSGIRIALVSGFALLLAVTIALNQYAFQPFFVLMEIILVKGMRLSTGAEQVLEYVLPGLVLSYIFWISIYQLLPTSDEPVPVGARFRIVRRLLGPRGSVPKEAKFRFFRVGVDIAVFSRPAIVFAVQIGFTAVAVTFLLLQKFVPAPRPSSREINRGVSAWCSLNNPVDNKWSFGQFCSMLLLMIPIFAALEAYHEFQPARVERRRRRSSQLALLQSALSNESNDVNVRLSMSLAHNPPPGQGKSVDIRRADISAIEVT